MRLWTSIDLRFLTSSSDSPVIALGPVGIAGAAAGASGARSRRELLDSTAGPLGVGGLLGEVGLERVEAGRSRSNLRSSRSFTSREEDSFIGSRCSDLLQVLLGSTAAFSRGLLSGRSSRLD
jgi:hypothetical protein